MTKRGCQKETIETKKNRKQARQNETKKQREIEMKDRKRGGKKYSHHPCLEAEFLKFKLFYNNLLLSAINFNFDTDYTQFKRLQGSKLASYGRTKSFNTFFPFFTFMMTPIGNIYTYTSKF